MQINFLIILKMLIFVQGYIIYDQGFNEYFSYTTGFGCTNSNTITATVTFSGTFQVPPQLLITPKKMTVKNYSSRTFDYNINFITTSQFQITITCTSDFVVRYQFDWYAINDNRIAILSKTIQTNCLDQSIYTHSHNLSKAKQAIVILQSWGNSVISLDFYIEVYEITSTTVKVKLHTTNSNLLQIGYQIVIGTQEAFVKSSLIVTPGGQNVLLTKSIPKLNLGILFTSMVGFGWSSGTFIRIQFTQQQILQNIEYTCESYDVSNMDTIRFNELWLFQEILVPMYVYSYRVTKKYEQYISHPIKVMIIELNSEYTNVGDVEVSIPHALTTVTIQIELLFQPGEKLIGTFLKCYDCGSQNVYRINQGYLCGNNFIRYLLRLKQTSNYDQTLKISIGIQDLAIKQIINQSFLDNQIAQLEFVAI